MIHDTQTKRFDYLYYRSHVTQDVVSRVVELNRQSSSEWACVGHEYRPLVYTVDLQVNCIQLSRYNLITRLWILVQGDTHPTLFLC